MSQTQTKTAVSVKSVAIPAEHGGWGFLLEPILLGLVLAPSMAGIGVCIAALAVFLLHQPIKIAVKDQMRGRIYARTQLARRFVVIYSVIALAGFLLALATATGNFWLPVLAVAPLALIQLFFEFRNEGRSAVAELFGALVLAAIAPAIILAVNGEMSVAFVAWLLMVLRAVPSILYVRTRLRLARGKATDTPVPLIAHGVGVVISVILVLSNLAGAVVLVGTGGLLARAVHGLLIAKPVPAKIVGIQELVFGILFTVICILALQ